MGKFIDTKSTLQLNSAFLRLSLITEGTTEKARQFKKPLKSVYSNNFGFNEQKCILNTAERTERIKQY